MATVYELLRFTLPYSIQNLDVDNSSMIKIKSQIEAKINVLNAITENIGNGGSKIRYDALIPQVFNKFKNDIQLRRVPNFDKIELRTLTYSLSYSDAARNSIFDEPNELSIALSVIEFKWKDSYIIGLFDCYLKNWSQSNPVSFKLLHEFGFKKLSQYDGESKIIKSLKSNLRFFNPNGGDLLLGSELAIKLIPLNQATKYLSLSENWFTYSYFSNVIVAFYERNKNYIDNLLLELQDALLNHSSNTRGTITSKRIVSKIIIQCNEIQHSHLQDRVKDMALTLIGDPALTPNWLIAPNMNDIEKSEITRAREILNHWITQEFIAVFFEKCINDERRKQFWLKMAKHVKDFKVFGPESTRRQLMTVQRVSKLVYTRYNVTTSSKKVAAFIMIIGSYKLIEFSDPGYAFYAYKITNTNAPSFEKKYQSVDYFRNGDLPSLVEQDRFNYYFSDEGRLIHRKDGWEGVFLEWINNKTNINV